MFLFLDVVSPIPEFHLFNDKKIEVSIKIANNKQKLSDQLIPKYLEIKTKYRLSQNMKKLIITTGPGSYTALRVGSSFIAGLSQSMNLPVSIISNEIFFNLLSKESKDTGIYFESSNNQKFFSYKRGSKFFHQKIENDNYKIPDYINFVLYNFYPPCFIDKKIKSDRFSVKNIVLKNLHTLEFYKKLIIKPIYVSNNKILN